MLKSSTEKRFSALHYYLTQFNLTYKTNFTEEVFNPIIECWKEIEENVSKDTTLDSIPEKYINQLSKATKTVYETITKGTNPENAAGKYTDENGVEKTEYNYFSRDIIQLGMVALAAHTGIYDRDPNSNGNLNISERRKNNIAGNLFNDREFPILPDSSISSYITYGHISNLEGWIDVAYYNMEQGNFAEAKENRPYSQVLAANEEIRREREAQNERNRIRNEEIQRQIDEERYRKEQEEIEKEFRLEYDSLKTVFEDVPNLEKPLNEDHAAFYRYMEEFSQRMGIGDRLTAQGMIDAMMNTNLNVGEDEFFGKVNPIFEKIKFCVMEGYAEKCIVENKPIDMNYAWREANELLSFLYCAVDPEAFSTQVKQFRVFDIASGKLGSTTKMAVEANSLRRTEIINHIRERYLGKEDVEFTASAEERFASFAQNGTSSSDIVNDAKAVRGRYSQLKEQRANGTSESTLHDELELKKDAIEAAYALEKRLETRYASGAARFFRYFSYKAQRNELASMKAALGIAADKRVADEIKAFYVNEFIHDNSDPKEYERQLNDLYATNTARDKNGNAILGPNGELVKISTKEIQKHIRSQFDKFKDANAYVNFKKEDPKPIVEKIEVDLSKKEEERRLGDDGYTLVDGYNDVGIIDDEKSDLISGLDGDAKEINVSSEELEANEDAFEPAETEEERLAREEKERIAREEEERIAREEEERIAREEEERIAREEEERIAREERERIARENKAKADSLSIDIKVKREGISLAEKKLKEENKIRNVTITRLKNEIKANQDKNADIDQQIGNIQNDMIEMAQDIATKGMELEMLKTTVLSEKSVKKALDKIKKPDEKEKRAQEYLSKNAEYSEKKAGFETLQTNYQNLGTDISKLENKKNINDELIYNAERELSNIEDQKNEALINQIEKDKKILADLENQRKALLAGKEQIQVMEAGEPKTELSGRVMDNNNKEKVRIKE